MSKKTKQKHNSITSRQQFLSPLQKKILLVLANTNPKNINETVKAIKGHYKSSWSAFKELERKNLIAPISKKLYQGREFPRYWLTEMGIILALSESVKPKILLRKTMEIYPENKNVQFLIEIIPILGKNALNMLYLSVVTNGKFEESDLISIFASQKKLSTRKIRKYNSIVKKRYPERYKQTQDYIIETRKSLKDLSDLFEV